jgi:hypothetical protein
MSLFPKIAHFIIFCKFFFVPLRKIIIIYNDGKEENPIHQSRDCPLRT